MQCIARCCDPIPGQARALATPPETMSSGSPLRRTTTGGAVVVKVVSATDESGSRTQILDGSRTPDGLWVRTGGRIRGVARGDVNVGAVERASKHVGERVLRLEDKRLLHGTGRFVDDVDLPGQVWMRVVRSTVSHGHMVGVDVSQAQAMRGVHAVLTGEDVAHVEPIPLRMTFEGIDLEPYLQPVLAQGRVRYVGDPVAVVVADDP